MRLMKAWAAVAMLGGIVLHASAQRSDLSGTWKLNLAKSFMAGDHPSNDYELTTVIENEGAEIKQTDVAKHVSMMNIPLPYSSSNRELIFDGKEHEAKGPSQFPGRPPASITILSVWQGNTLLITESGVGFGGFTTTHRRYYLNDDKTQLIELVESHSGFIDSEQRLVFDWQTP